MLSTLKVAAVLVREFMLTPEEKSFFIEIAIGAIKLSGCSPGRAAVLVRDRQILSHGYNRKIMKNEKWEISAIYDVIFGARQEDLTGTTLFCTYFPTVEDLMLIVATGVSSINFIGGITDKDAVFFLNKITGSGIPLEIVELEAKL